MSMAASKSNSSSSSNNTTPSVLHSGTPHCSLPQRQSMPTVLSLLHLVRIVRWKMRSSVTSKIWFVNFSVNLIVNVRIIGLSDGRRAKILRWNMYSRSWSIGLLSFSRERRLTLTLQFLVFHYVVSAHWAPILVVIRFRLISLWLDSTGTMSHLNELLQFEHTTEQFSCVWLKL